MERTLVSFLNSCLHVELGEAGAGATVGMSPFTFTPCFPRTLLFLVGWICFVRALLRVAEPDFHQMSGKGVMCFLVFWC